MYNFLKRIIDLTVSISLLIIISPILLFSIILIKLESKGPVFFKQERIGKNGVIFKLYKLRTMLHNNNFTGQVYGTSPDVTKVGFYLRRFKIDELPQLINVIVGQMSLVGPRPCLPTLLDSFDDNAKYRLMVKPGLTGWAQVNGNIYNSWSERWLLDRYYVENKSLLFDFKILFMTIGVIIFGEEK